MVIGAKLFTLHKSKKGRLVILSLKRGEATFTEAEFLLNFNDKTFVRVDTSGPSALAIPTREVLFHGSSRDLAGGPVLLEFDELIEAIFDSLRLIP